VVHLAGALLVSAIMSAPCLRFCPRQPRSPCAVSAGSPTARS
jgi:hypothetical protein